MRRRRGRSCLKRPADLLAFAVVAIAGVLIIAALRSARDKAEAAARDAQTTIDRTRRTLDAISDAFYVFDRQWRFVYLNDVAARQTGKPKEALLGKVVWEEFPQTRSSKSYAELQRALAERVEVHFEDRFEASGNWYEVDACPSEEGLTVLNRDITGRKRAEEAQRFLAAIVRSSEDAIIGKSLDGTILSWSPGAERIYGYSAAEIVGRPISTIYAPDHFDELPGIFEKLRRGGYIEHQEAQRVRKDGTRIDVSLTISPVRDDTGQIVGASTIARDITERKRAERERAELLAREQEARCAAELATERVARLQAVTAALSAARTPAQVAEIVVHEGIAAMGAESGIVAALPADGGEPKILSEVRYPQAIRDSWQALSISIWDTPIGHAAREGEPVFLESLDALLEKYPRLRPVSRSISGGARAALPLKVHGRTIGSLWLAFSQSRAFGEEDRNTMLVLAQQCAEALERARLYEAEQAARTAAENANRLKDQFLAVVSHELRTPLTAILGWSAMLQSRSFAPAEHAAALETIHRNAKAQSRLIDDILDVSRIITGKLRLEVRELEIPAVIDAAIEIIRPAADAKNIRIQKVIDPNAGVVLGDAERLQQIVWNLLSNAVKFTPKGGRVQVALQRVNSHVEITVSDTGKGIHPEFLPLVFDLFRQADSSSTRVHGGLGLGLAIVRHLVELHGGTVHADSPGEGQGATFAVKLPVVPVSYRERAPRLEPVREHPTADLDTGVPQRPGALRGIRALVVDDEPDTRELLTFLLSKAGAEVIAAASTPLALELWDRTHPDVMVADIEMPGEDGYALVRKLRATEAERGRRRTPAIALTAYARVADKIQALEAGYQVHLAKPIEPIELVMAIAALVEKAREPE